MLSCRLPALFSVQRGASAARYPTLAGWLRAKHQAVAKLHPGDLPEVASGGLPTVLTEVIETIKPRPKKRVEEVKKTKMSAMDRLKSITQREPAKKTEQGNLIEADSDQLFARLDRILRDAGILS
jgi:electron transfer flavoprotein alpha/beta subunit